MNRSGIAVLLALGNLFGAGLPAQGLPDADVSGQERSAQPVQHVQFDVARFDSLTARLLSEIFDSAASRGLPTKSLVLRALEGHARRAPGAKIVSVVREHANAMSEARQALGAASTAAELTVGADAIRAGIDPRTLSQIRASRLTGSVETPLMVLTDLIIRGVPAVMARDAVSTLSRLPKADDALMGLQLTVAKNAVRGPGMALDALNRYVKGTVSGSVPPSTPVTTDRKPIRPPTP